MANSLLDPWEIRPEPLRSEVQFGLVLTVWLCVNEKPPLVPLERQSVSCAGFQRRPLPRLAGIGNLPGLVRFRRIVAKLRRGVSILPSCDQSRGPDRQLESQSSFDLFRREPCRENGGLELVPYPLRFGGKNGSKFPVVRSFRCGQIHGRMPFEIRR